MTQQLRISQIARETGGEAFFPTSARELHEVYAQILDELASRYTLGYVSGQPQARDGKFRKVEVKLTKPDLQRRRRSRTRSGLSCADCRPGWHVVASEVWTVLFRVPMS